MEKNKKSHKQDKKERTHIKLLSKKGLVSLAFAGVMIASPFMLAGCSGEAGKDGADGTVWRVGTSYTEFTNAKDGDFFIDKDDYTLYQKTGDRWTVVMTNYGKPGANGATGQTGPQGTTGPEGPQGIPGATGSNGEDGKDGSSWITGVGLPSANNGNNGDTYLDISTNYIYVKALGVWNKVGELAGDRDVTVNVEEKTTLWKGKTAVFVGDSITYGSKCDGDKYWEVLEDKLEFAQVTGMGIGKSCISATSTNGTSYGPLSTRYNDIPEADLIQIFMGTNDYGFNTPLGTIADTTDVSFYGALNVVIPALQAKYPSSRLVFVTPLHRYGQHNLNYDYEKNTAGHSLSEYVNAIKEVCERNSVPVIDLFNISGLNPSLEVVRDMYIPDGLHPNTEGHKHIANIMSTYLNLYATDHSVEVSTEEIKELNEISVEIGSTYYPSTSANCRLSSTYNVYLEAGETISLTDSANYKFFLYLQTGATPIVVSDANRYVVMNNWCTGSFTATSTGWYGVTLAKADVNEAFDSSVTSSQTLADYLTIGDVTEEEVKSLNEISLVIASTYYPSSSANCRLSSAYNVYMEAGETIALTDSTNYKFFLYPQTGATPTVVSDADRMSLMSAWCTGSFTTTRAGWYGVTLAKADVNEAFDSSVTSSQTLADYLTIDEVEEEEETVKALNEISVEIASTYYPSSSANCRLSSTYNIYLEAGETIALTDSTNYKFFLYPQTGATPTVVSDTDRMSLMSAWCTGSFTATNAGWYGVTLAKADHNVAFDASVTATQTLADYLTIDEVEEEETVKALNEISLVIASTYYPSSSANCRLSSVFNVYLEEGQTLTLTDSTNYKFFLYVQTGETPTVVSDTDRTSLMSAWCTGSFTATNAGWYGITLAKTDHNVAFDASVTATQTLADYFTIA